MGGEHSFPTEWRDNFLRAIAINCHVYCYKIETQETMADGNKLAR